MADKSYLDNIVPHPLLDPFSRSFAHVTHVISTAAYTAGHYGLRVYASISLSVNCLACSTLIVNTV